MINLLPTEVKRQVKAARTNVILYRYCLLILATALVLGAVFAAGFWANTNERTHAEKARGEAQAALASYNETREAAESFAKDLTAAKDILSGEVRFSQLVLDIARIVPQGVILNNLSLGNDTDADSPIDINGRAVSYDSAVALRNSLGASPIFEEVTISSINQADPSGTDTASPLAGRYPFTISIKAQFSKEATEGTAQ